MMNLQEAVELELELEPGLARSAPAVVEPARPTPVLVPSPTSKRIRLWDLPTRVFHWSLVVAVVVAVVSGEVGGTWMEVHGKAGLTILGLVMFRMVWGLIGSTYSRFLSFVPTPAKIRAYLQGTWQGVGHNPLGALSVFALLGLLAVQASTGLFTNDDISFTGPLFERVDEAVATYLTGLHRQLANVLLGVLGLHVVAIFFYVRFKKDNLVKPMVTGWKDVPPATPVGKRGKPIAFIVAVSLALGAVYVASGKVSLEQKNPAPVVVAPTPAAGKTPSW